MKKLLVSMVCLIAIVTAYAQDYYWYENEKISIEEVGTQFYIAFEDENIDKVLEQNKNLVIYKGDLGLKGINYISSSEEELGKIHWAIVEKELKDAIVDQYDILYCTSNYTSENTYKESACISNIFYVKLKQQEDYSFLEEKAKELNVTIVGKDTDYPLLYILLCNKTTEGNALTCANAFYETGKYAYTEVNWMMSLRLADDGESSYYWYKGEKIQLKEVKTEYFICYTDKNLFDYLKKSDDVIQNTSGMSFPNMNLQAGVDSKLQEYFYSIVPATKLDEILQNYEIPYISKNYKLDGSEEDFCISNIFYVKLKSEDDFSVLQNMAEQYDVTIVGNNEFNPLWYSLICFNTKNGDALQLANLFCESGAFAASEPDLMDDLIYGKPTAVISVEQEREVSLRMTNKTSLNLQANLSNLHSVISINVYNIQGVQVKGMTLCNTNSFNEEIELCGEPIGLYVVVVQADGKIIFSEKVLICK